MSSNLWVGNLAAGVTDSDLKNMFEKLGGVSVVTCSLLRNYAFVYLKNAEDARKVKERLNGVVLRGYPLKIDFAKRAKPCKCLWVSVIGTSISKEDLEENFSKFGKIEEFKFQPHKNSAIIDYFKLDDAIKAFKAMRGSAIRVDYSRSQSARHILPSEGPKRKDELPSNVLCISYPPAVHVDEQMLHNALILFGEIETIKSFPSRSCSFVEFRSMEEALSAKSGLQGKLFNDPRISSTFSRNEPAPSPYFTGSIGPRPVPLANGMPFHAPHLDVIAQPIVPSRFRWPVSSMRPFALPDPNFGGPDPSFVTATGDLNWRSSPSNQMLSSPSAGMRPLTKSTQGTWDGFDANQIQRAPKRLRNDGHMPVKEMNNHVQLDDQVFRGVSPNARFAMNPNVDPADVNYMWRGILAKGGTPVCRARCVPVGDWIGYEMPEIVNCSARTGLDMLAKHYADAIGFDIVYFLPDSEEDFASYTEFLHYMGDWNRAGVVKFGDGTTLFLVPPSDFLETVLKVSGPAHLYGVVLKFPQHADRVPPVTATSTTSVGLSLTPELVASLASLAKVNSNGQQLSGNTVPEPVFNERQLQGKMHEHETSNLTGDFMQSNKVNDPMQVTQQYQADYPRDLHSVGNVVTSSSQVYNTNAYETQSMVPCQQKLEFDADKNQRYQSTLQFAAFRYSRSSQEQKQMANSKVASFVKGKRSLGRNSKWIISCPGYGQKF